MFVDFDVVFGKKEQQYKKIPKVLLDYYNKNLPQGFKYRYDKEQNIYVLGGSDNEITVSGLIPAPSSEQREVLGESYTPEDVLQYSFNSQEPIPLKFAEDGRVFINGREFSPQDLIKAPFEPYFNYQKGEWLLVPPKFFPQSFPLELSDGEYSITLQISRIPSRSINVELYKSTAETPIEIEYSINKKAKEMRFSMKIQMLRAQSVSEIISAASIYNAFQERKGIINGVKLESEAKRNEAKQTVKFGTIYLAFWKKVCIIEEKIGVHFPVHNRTITFGEARIVEALYQTLINKVPIRDEKRLDRITFRADGQDFLEIKRSEVVIPVSFGWEKEFVLFGEKIKTLCYTMVFNSRIKDVEKQGNVIEVELTDENDSNKIYSSSLLFASEEEADKMISSLSNEGLVDLFRNSHPVDYYLPVKE